MRLLKRLKSKRGESLAEILIAVLIAALGCMLIATMFVSAFSLNKQASDMDDAFYQSMSDTEKVYESNSSGSGKIVINEDDGVDNDGGLEVDVDIYGEGKNITYKRSGH